MSIFSNGGFVVEQFRTKNDSQPSVSGKLIRYSVIYNDRRS